MIMYGWDRKKSSVILALLLILGVAIALIAPDTTDDVDGVVRPHRLFYSPESALAFLVVPLFICRKYISRLPELASSALLTVLCTCRC
jgi:hypothetical protein